jgi:hypothetical protein
VLLKICNMKTLKEINEVFYNKGLAPGRLISYSKSSYRKRFPENEVYFNGNIFTKELGKVWWGDIDLTVSSDILQEIANEIQMDLFVLSEMDGRFENEDKVFDEVKKVARRFYLTN